MKLNLSAVAVALGTTDEVLRVDTEHIRIMSLQVKNVGANPLDVFEVWGYVTETGDAISLLSVAGNFTTPIYPLLQASASPVALAAAEKVWMVLDVSAFALIVVKASSGTGATTVDFHGIGKP